MTDVRCFTKYRNIIPCDSKALLETNLDLVKRRLKRLEMDSFAQDFLLKLAQKKPKCLVFWSFKIFSRWHCFRIFSPRSLEIRKHAFLWLVQVCWDILLVVQSHPLHFFHARTIPRNYIMIANLKARMACSFAPVYPHMRSEGSPQRKVKWKYVADVSNRGNNDQKVSWILVVLEGETYKPSSNWKSDSR